MFLVLVEYIPTLLVCTCALYVHHSFPNSKSTIKPEPVKYCCFVNVFTDFFLPVGLKSLSGIPRNPDFLALAGTLILQSVPNKAELQWHEFLT